MKFLFKFIVIGAILGLFTEFVFKILAKGNYQVFMTAVTMYPFVIALSYALHRFLDRRVKSRQKADFFHYFMVGTGGLMFEWVVIGYGPGSGAFQLGMFAMWTTFCFGPRILTRDSEVVKRSLRWFWGFFGISAAIISFLVAIAKVKGAKIVIAVYGLSAMYIPISIWLLVLAWRSNRNNMSGEKS